MTAQDNSFKNLIIEDVGAHVRVLKVARPKALNALNHDTLTELKKALVDTAADKKIRVLVLTGDGDKAFIAGADIAEMQGLSVSHAADFSRLGHEVSVLFESMPQPVIAAVNGFALGGGAEMALCCDFIWASDKAVFGQPEVSVGVIPGFGGTARLGRFVGDPMAKELVYSGRKVDAAEALRIGLVNRVVAAAEFMPAVIDFAQKIAAQSYPAVKACKKLMNDIPHSRLDGEARAFSGLFATPDQREGMSAFLEKRKPAFI